MQPVTIPWRLVKSYIFSQERATMQMQGLGRTVIFFLENVLRIFKQTEFICSVLITLKKHEGEIFCYIFVYVRLSALLGLLALVPCPVLHKTFDLCRQ